MASKGVGICLIILAVLTADNVFASHRFAGRSLLQAKKDCLVDFEHMDYTIITDKCKGPKYQPQACCDAFKQFACPVVDQLNDLTNICADTMFSYINGYGNYPLVFSPLFATKVKRAFLVTNSNDLTIGKLKEKRENFS